MSLSETVVEDSDRGTVGFLGWNVVEKATECHRWWCWLTTSLLVPCWAAGGLVIGATLTLWMRKLLTSRRPGLTAADWIAPLLTAILFGILAWRFGPHFRLLPYSGLAAIGIALAVIDVIEQRLPSPLVYCGLAVVGALLATSTALHSTMPSLLRALAGMAALMVFYLVLALVSGGGLGAGDLLTELPVDWHGRRGGHYP